MKIKLAKRSEIRELAKVEMSSGYHKKKFDFKPYLEELFKEKHCIFCAKEDENIVAYISLGKDGEIGFLAVTKKFQGKGIANYLLKKVISFAKEKKMKRLYLDVKEENTAAIKLYLKNDFVIVKKYKKKVDGKEIKKLMMELKLK